MHGFHQFEDINGFTVVFVQGLFVQVESRWIIDRLVIEISSDICHGIIWINRAFRITGVYAGRIRLETIVKRFTSIETRICNEICRVQFIALTIANYFADIIEQVVLNISPLI